MPLCDCSVEVVRLGVMSNHVVRFTACLGIPGSLSNIELAYGRDIAEKVYLSPVAN